jgi:predicted permease
MSTLQQLIEGFAYDLRYTTRMMRKSPGFASTAIVTLALAIGATTALFTVIHAVLLRPLHYPNPDRLVRLSSGATKAHVEEFRAHASSYVGVGDYLMQSEDVTLAEGATPEVIKQARVSANFLAVLGVDPLLGRSFNPEEDNPSGPPVVMISADVWQQRFAGDPMILGRTINLGGTAHAIIGVMPSDFRFPFEDVSVWVTQPGKNVNQTSPLLVIFGRLGPQITMAQANAELEVLEHAYALAHPEMLDAKPGRPKRIVPVKDQLVAGVRSMLWTLFGAVSFVLLIACANVAGLLLARAAARGREFALRAALGAPRGRLMGQLLTESMLLALPAGLLGLLFALWILTGISRLPAVDLPRVMEIHLDLPVLAFAIAVSAATGILFGLIPSVAASRPDLEAMIKSRGQARRGSRISGWFETRNALVAGQVALSIVLLIATALLIESLARLARVDPGFDASHLLTLRISLSPARYAAEPPIAAFYEELVRRVESLPGVRSATVSLTLPMMGYPMTPAQPADAPLRKLNERPLGMIQFVTADYFRTLRAPLRLGREFTAKDRAEEPLVVIINEAMARQLWPDYPSQNPIGKQLLVGANPKPLEIVGIVGDVRQSLDGEPTPAMYRSALQAVSPTFMIAVRTDGDPLRLAEPVRRVVLGIDPAQPISAVRTMDELTEAAEGQRRLVLLLLGVFAAAATLLTMIGIYGAISYWVVQRTRELGIRRALGAPAVNILWLVMGRGLGLTTAGIAIGITGAFALTRFLQALLFHVSPTDPLTLAGVAFLIAALTVIASFPPARRATRVDPMDTLRAE